MRGSKSLKPKKYRWLYEYDEEKGLINIDNISYLFKEYVWWPVSSFYRRIKERMKRSYDYARFGWLNYDFDMSCAWDLLEFKLKRLHSCLESGCAVQEPEDMAALKELIKIVRRLGRDCYDDKYLRQHDRKWGRIESRTTPNYNDKGNIVTYTWHSWRKNCPENAPEEVKKQERNEFRTCYEKGEEDRIKDIKRMGEILVKHGQKFWD